MTYDLFHQLVYQDDEFFIEAYYTHIFPRYYVYMMKAVASDYRKAIELIDYEKDYFQVDDIIYRARGDSRKLNLNSYYAPIPYTVIRDGLQVALDKLEIEISKMEKELKDWL